MPSVRVIIVNYRTPELALDCLRSLAPEIAGITGCRVVVVDGGSGDGSAERIAEGVKREGWGSWVELVSVAQNHGFAAGNNAVLRPLLAAANPPDYMLLLNPDTVVRQGALWALIEFMEAHPKVGIAGSRLEDLDGTPQRSAFRFPTVASEFESGLRLGLVSRLLQHRLVAPPVRDACHRTDWVAGASVIVQREVFESIGLLDEGYFLYYEETDFCLRASRAGWECWYVPASRVVHLVGQSSGVTNPKRLPKPLPRYWFESRGRYFCKNHGLLYNWFANTAWLLGFTLRRIRAWLQRKPDNTPANFVRDLIRFAFLPAPIPRKTL